MMRCTTMMAVLAVAMTCGAGVGRAEGGDKAKWEEMRKKHEECIKSSGAFDQKTLDALGECHKAGMKNHDGKHEKGDHEAMKAEMESCLQGKGITLTAAQQEAIKGCRPQHDHG